MNNTVKSNTTAPEPYILHRKIGSTHYNVRIHYNPNARETLNDKVRRLLKNELQSAPDDGIMKSLQAGWLSERKNV